MPVRLIFRQRMRCKQVFDVLRRKYVALTPEEGVRQHFVAYLIAEKGYPQGLMANEVELKCGVKKLRCDTVLYSKTLTPFMIIEYKAPTVQLSQKVFNQLLDYNSILGVKYLVMTNGQSLMCCVVNEGKYEFLTTLPDYADL
ncbi:MAG: type I restriction enzyme HsdR N-terminal domain-containing protein [Prevotella sp.]|nr:type I restriction enzyme HsdR N-terminal domain-containing protein [Candidatus Equicola faecalis]